MTAVALRWLIRHPLAPLVACSGLAVALLAARVLQSRSPSFMFLCWNLVLAWVPLLLARWASRLSSQGVRGRWLLVLLALWLLFFPNAPYLVTDFLHLRARRAIPMWYDVGLLTAFAFTGMVLAMRSLEAVQRLVQARLGRWAAWSTVMLASLLAGAGIFIGRFLRWNSWDAVFRPRTVLADAAHRFLHPGTYPRSWGVTLVFGALLLALYIAWVAPRPDVAPLPVRPS